MIVRCGDCRRPYWRYQRAGFPYARFPHDRILHDGVCWECRTLCHACHREADPHTMLFVETVERPWAPLDLIAEYAATRVTRTWCRSCVIAHVIRHQLTDRFFIDFIQGTTHEDFLIADATYSHTGNGICPCFQSG